LVLRAPDVEARRFVACAKEEHLTLSAWLLRAAQSAERSHKYRKRRDKIRARTALAAYGPRPPMGVKTALTAYEPPPPPPQPTPVRRTPQRRLRLVRDKR